MSFNLSRRAVTISAPESVESRLDRKANADNSLEPSVPNAPVLKSWMQNIFKPSWFSNGTIAQSFRTGIPVVDENGVSTADVSGTDLFRSTVTLPNGNIVLIPYASDTFGIFNPRSYTITYPPLADEDFLNLRAGQITTYRNSTAKFIGGIAAEDGTVVCIPFNLDGLYKYYPETNQIERYVSNVSSGGSRFAGAAYLSNKEICLTPFSAVEIHLYNAGINSFRTLDVSSLLTTNLIAGSLPAEYFLGCSLTHDNNVVFAPFNSTRIGIYNSSTHQFSLGPDISHPADGEAFRGCTLLPDGDILFCPAYKTKIGLYTPSSGKYREVDMPDVPLTQGGVNYPRFSSARLLPSGNVLLVPRQLRSFGIYNPVSGEFALQTSVSSLETRSAVAIASGQNAIEHSSSTFNGDILCISTEDIAPIVIKSTTVPHNAYSVVSPLVNKF